ncbi:hypothetical protein [Mycobacteroides immunogenum]|uniref:hypothetical protein n=1 Tax=Mycobacteroides immunogenum TaxID=83262 RepID=UPI000AC37F84|nr:hypothetical protein [Mycobacteroides immunogenum]MCV7305775.1 hypothetical protein [Mycobacteroides immunogenum]WJR36703.1 hypothetical protein P3F83_12825 [Mycobacteroides immunogenum]
MSSKREAITLIIGALMLFGAATTVAEAEERAHAQTAASVSASVSDYSVHGTINP